jgi:sortase (surface protein transpeptidase)
VEINGGRGNMVLSGHNDVIGWTLVEPNQVEILNPTPDERLSLISFYPCLIDKQRIMVKARLK